MTNEKLNIRRKKVSLDAKKARGGYFFVLPFLLGIFLIYIPILLDSVWLSFGKLVTTKDGSYYQPHYLEYYKSALSDSTFVSKLLEGLQQLIFEVPAVIIFSLFIAVVLNQKMLGRAVFRAIFFVPVIISTGLMESINANDMMSDASAEGIQDGSSAEGGNQIVSTLDVQALFANMAIGGQLVEYVVNIVNDVYNIINYSGVQMLIFLAGLQSISPQIYEACRIDGATGWETFWKITFPMISPMILVNAVYTLIDSFTRSTNPMMAYLNSISLTDGVTAMSWMYFMVVILIIAVIAGIISSFIFYQRKD